MNNPLNRPLPDPWWKRNPECQGEESPVYKSKANVPIDGVTFSVVIIWSGAEGPDYDSIDVKNRGHDANKILHQEVKDLLVDTVAKEEGRL